MKSSPLQSSPIHKAQHSIRTFSARVLMLVSAFALLGMLSACSTQISGLGSSSGAPSQVQTAIPTLSPELTKYLQHNLLVNGDAEAGPAGNPDGATAAQKIAPSVPGWTRTGSLTVYPYVTGTTIGGVGVGDPRPDDHGNNFFTGGPDAGPNALATATQSIDISPLALATDTGKLSFSLSGYLGGWGSYYNQASVTVQFLDTNKKGLSGSAQIGPVTSGNNHQPNLGTGMWQRSTSNKIPVGTRYAVVTLTITVDPQERVACDNAANSGFADSLSFQLSA